MMMTMDLPVALRYLDTSYSIFKGWSRGQEKSAFPGNEFLRQALSFDNFVLAVKAPEDCNSMNNIPSTQYPTKKNKSQLLNEGGNNNYVEGCKKKRRQDSVNESSDTARSRDNSNPVSANPSHSLGRSTPSLSLKQTKIPDSLHLQYITEKILAAVLPVQNGISSEQNDSDKFEKELIVMLEQKHKKNYQLFDLESCIATVTLEKLCELCKRIDFWLRSGTEKVVVLQDRGDHQRLCTAIAAYLEYHKICGVPARASSSQSLRDNNVKMQSAIGQKLTNLDIFSMEKFIKDVVGPLRIPSYKRYLKYFSGLLSGVIKVNSLPIYMEYVAVESPPSWLYYDSDSSTSAEWRCFIKVYEGDNCVFTSDIYVIPIATQSFVLHCDNLRLRGDITIRCYQIIPNDDHTIDRIERDLIFSVQFHTCAVSKSRISFAREDLDNACNDPRFPEKHKVTLHLNQDKHRVDHSGTILQSPLVRTEPLNSVARWDSFEERALNKDSSGKHLQGPVDGSLYATITKSKLPSVILSPPPEFSSPTNRSNSTQSLVLIDSDRHTLSSSGSAEYAQIRNKCLTPTPYSTTNTENRFRAFSTPPQDSTYSTSPSSARYRYVYRKPSPIYGHRGSVISQRHEPEQYIQEIRIVEEVEPAKPRNPNYSVSSSSSAKRGDFVRSPLTLSMDSGISSSGITNRRVQESSASPTSFPSQVSPQEDKHRELDDILTDMLKNVRDIPDVNNGGVSQGGRPTQKVHQRSSLSQQSSVVVPESNNSQYNSIYNNNANTVKRSQSYTSSILNSRDRDDTNSVTSKSTNASSQRTNTQNNYQQHHSNHHQQNIHHDPFDTASTTTTLTPPPSESGRETPFSGLNFTNTFSTNNRYDEENTTNVTNTVTKMNLQRQQMSQNNVQGSDNTQSVISSPRQRQISATSDEESENIPYHAREHSRPFTYGNIAGGASSPGNGTGMLKMQSGLSSPSLVRKQLGQTDHKKVPIRNEFEEMLRERREKIDNEKYSISDSQKSPNSYSSGYKVSGSGGFDYNKKWDRSEIQQQRQQPLANGYKYEPIKRSNTMDGYSRSYSGEGESWLHKQQQRLRAKKEQQQYRNDDYYQTTTYNTVGAGRQGKYNASKRDGYTSDTGFAADEVDYRQTYARAPPASRATYNEPGRNYHTITTTTTKTINKERPFVAVKRAHDQSKRGYDSDSYVSPLTLLNSSPHGHIAQLTPMNKTSNSRGTESESQLQNGRTQTMSRNENLASPNGHTKLFNHRSSPTDISTSSSSGFCSSASNSSLRHAETMLDALLESLSNSILMVNHPVRRNGNLRASHPDELIDRGKLEEGVNACPFDLNRINAYSSPLSIEKYGGVSWIDQVREESFSSYNEDFSPSIATSSRPETPAFPVTPRTPYHYNSPALPPKSPTLHRKDYSGHHIHHVINQNDSVSSYTSRRNSLTSNANSEPQEVAAHLVKFVRDTSRHWYKPNISREEAASLLRHAPPGTFIVRDSKSFANAFGLVIKVSHPPPNGAKAPPGDELVRHFLIEPTTRGVRLKGCANEPVFTSLSALVYQHSITPLALPCRLLIPDQDIQATHWEQQQYSPAQKQLQTHGAACNILYLCSVETESLTGPEAIRKAVSILFAKRPLPTPTQVHFKVSNQGVTLTDNTRQLFFRKHYPSHSISFVGLDPDERRWSVPSQFSDVPVVNNRVFAFVARRSSSSSDNICNIFCELEPTQPATAIVSYANNTIIRGASFSQPATPQIL